VDCLPNEEIFTELARMGYEKPTTKLTFYKAFFSSQWKFLINIILQSMSPKRTSWNEFSSVMASAVICLSTGRKFNFSKYIFKSLVRNVDSSTKFYMYPRVGNGCSGVETPLFKGMLVAKEPEEQGNEEEQGNADTTAEEPETAVPKDAGNDQPIPSPTPLTPPPQQPQDEALDAYATLARRVEHLEQDKVAQDLEIIKLKTRVKKLEKTNKAKTLKLRRLRKVGTSQRVDTSDDTLIEDVSNQGRADIYHIDMDHAAKVLSMQEDESEVQEAVEVVTTAKLITEVVAAVSETVSTAAIIHFAVPEIISAAAAIPTITAPPVKVAAPIKTVSAECYCSNEEIVRVLNAASAFSSIIFNATDDSLAVLEHTTVETPMNMSPENKDHFLAEKEAIHLILSGIGDEIYSTVDPCQTSQEMWEAIERHNGKEIAKPITPPFETASEEDNDPEQAQRDKDMQKNLALIAKYFKKIYKPTNNNLRKSSNSKNKNVDTTLRFKNNNQSGQFRNQRTVNVAAARENVGMQYDWLADTGEEVYKQELEAHYSYMAKIQEVPTADSGTDSEPVEQIQKQLKKANTTLAQELKECKTILAETSKSLGESISVRDSCLVALQTKQTEFEKYKAFNDRTIYYDKFEHKLNEALGQLAQKDTVIKEGLKTKAYELSVVKEKHDDKIKRRMHADLKYVETLEKEIDKLESDKAEFLDTYDVILQECVSNDVKCSYLMSLSDLDALDELQCLYLHKVKNDTVCNEKASNDFQNECEQYFEIQDLKDQLQYKNIAINELKKLIEKCKGKSVDTKFDRPSVVRQPNA
nr:glutamic acid-rich protein-like [Tanacetum cinerariifolium]